MSDVLKQTLYWSAVPTLTAFDNNGTGGESHSNFGSAAQSHDANDGTAAVMDCSGDFDTVNGSGTWYLDGAVDTAAVSGTVSFVRMKFRAKYAHVGGGAIVVKAYQPRINATNRGSQIAITTSFADYSQDFATDPADSAAWTNAKVNAQSWGARLDASTDSPFGDPQAYLSEFSLELWGPPADQESTPASVGIVMGVGAPTPVPGVVTSLVESVGILAAVASLDSSLLFFQSAPRDPQAVTSYERRVLRVNHASLGDGNALTGTADAVAPIGPVANPAGGTVKVTAPSLTAPADGELATWSSIHHIKFMAYVLQVDNLNPTPPANRRFFYTLGGTPATTPALVHASVTTVWKRSDDGIDPETLTALDPYFLAQSADIETKPGGGAWTPADVIALTSIGIGHDYPALTDYSDVRCAELWVEVYGTLGPDHDGIGKRMTFPQPKLRFDFPTLKDGEKFPNLKGVGKIGTIRRRFKFGGE
jgi:hypothetical protein